ncbi:hypothetical protein [Vannielia litorea]|uniref:hypothetical protein n=1 Tax=Vannielia litorea TaxID=1217970 RepID=UPI001C960617|nr:hypothetical protein [Vannielia litorea]MBY6048656.1 hypothetical protein [Vannielia litorea]MBY6076070.1 hypothetical protein [Vannielia litorea]
MVFVFLLIAGAAAGFAINRGTDRRFDDEIAAVLGAGVVALCWIGLRMLPLIVGLVKYALILAVIAGAAAALYFIVRKK